MGKFSAFLKNLIAAEPISKSSHDKTKQLVTSAVAADAHSPQTWTETTLGDVVDKYDIVEVVPGTEEHGPFVLVTEKGTDFDPFSLADANYPATEANVGTDFRQSPENEAYLNKPSKSGEDLRTQSAVVGQETAPFELKEKPRTFEIGSSEPSPYSSWTRNEYNRDLIGIKGLEKYDRMRKSDGVIGGVLLAVKTPVMAGRWFIKPAKKERKHERIAEHVWNCLTEYMTISWTQVLQESMLSTDFGVWIWHKVWDIRTINGKEWVVLKKLAPRHPMDIKEVKYDSHGGPKSVVFFADNAKGEDEVKIKDLLVITFRREANNILGTSILRNPYKHWYFKDQLYKIDAIQKERHGIGVPVIKLPPNFDPVKDVSEANALGRNLRANERAHIVLPPNWEIMFAKLEGNPVDCIKSIEHHNEMIRESALASFIGSKTATKEEDTSMFLKATRFIATTVCDAFNLYLIPEIVNYNFDNITEYPKLAVRQIGEQADLRVFSFALRNMIGAGVIRPDDVLESYVREVMDLPDVDLATVRVVKTPQSGTPAPNTLPNATPGTKTELPQSSNQKGDNGSGKEDPATNSPGLPRQTPLPTVNTGGNGIGKDRGGQS